MAYSFVQWGAYFGNSLAEMQAQLARYKATVAALTPGSGNIVSASVNGSSFTYGPNGTWSLEEWQQQIQSALSQVDDTVPDVPNATVAVMR